MISKIPSSYDQMNYKTYVAIINKIPSERPEGITQLDWSRNINLATLSIILGVSEAEVENMKAATVVEYLNTIKFLETPFAKWKPIFEVKKFDELTFDEFSNYQGLRLDQWNNLESILLLVCKGVTPEQIDAMNIQQVMDVFFCLSKLTKRFLIYSKYLAVRRLIIITTRSLLSRKRF